jgi:citrate lyase subunit beta/citryl-CoA lyase
MIRPRRSLLYVPGNNARALEKAGGLACDGVIVDLEDSVLPEAKSEARERAAAAVAAKSFGRREVIVRINSPETKWWLDDLAMVTAVSPDGVLVPKVAAARHLQTIADRLNDISADRAIRLWAMIELPVAVLNAGEIAAAATDEETRLAGLVIGPNDLIRETRARMVAGRAPMLPWLSACVLAARAYGLSVIDGVYNDFRDDEGFTRECAQARDMGFDGKSLIHPNQIAPCNACFAPEPAEVAKARRVIDAFADPVNAGRGVIQLDGEMVERLHLESVRRTIAFAEAIAALA